MMHHRKSCRALVGTLFCLFSSLSLGLAAEFRGISVDAWGTGFLNAAQVTDMVNYARNNNFNALIVEVRRRGDAFYMPQAPNGDPRTTAIASGYDALQEIINQCHNSSPRIEVHAWVVAHLIWSSSSAPSQAGHVFNTHPEYLTKNSAGNLLDTDNAEGYYLDPGHPGTCQWNYNMAKDIVSRYNVDGLHWDYIRYPTTDSGYNDTALARYNAEYGLSGVPSASNAQFSTWRRRQITDFLRWCNTDLWAIKSNIVISASVFSSRTDAFNARFQDWAAWNNEGLIDLCMPMTYIDYSASTGYLFNSRVDDAYAHQGCRRVYVIQGGYMNPKEHSLIQLQYVRNKPLYGYSFYDYRTPSDNSQGRDTVFPYIRDNFQPSATTTPALPWKATPTKGVIKGTVTRKDTGDPLYNATVTLGTSPSRTQKTDVRGKYVFLETDPGTYGISVYASGFESKNASATIRTNIIGTLDFAMSLPTAPSILVPPQSSTVAVSNTASFSVIATGTPPLSFQWRFNGSPISGATGTTYNKPNVAYGDAGGYSVVVTNYLGRATSAVASLTVVAYAVPPLLTTQPFGQAARAGDNITLAVVAEGTSPLGYVWRRDGAVIGGANAATLSLTNLQPAQAGAYSVIVSNSVGILTSALATVSVNYTLTATATGGGRVTRSPDLAYYPANTVVTLTATSTGGTFTGWSGDASGASTPLNVTMNGNKTITANFSVADIIIDNPQATYVGSWVPGTSAGDKYNTNYQYATCVNGTATRTATYRPNILAAGNYDVFIWYPAGGNRAADSHWVTYYNGGNVSTLVNQRANGGSWQPIASGVPLAAGTAGYVQLSNDGAAITNSVFSDGVKFAYAASQNTAPYLITQPAAQAVMAGNNAVFAVSAGGSATLTYQWRFNGNAIGGATSSTYTRAAAQAGDAGSYSVAVSNTFGGLVSSNVSLAVNVFPSITAQPQSATNNQGAAQVFSAAAAGTGPFSYQWRFNGLNIAGATAATYTRSGLLPSDEGKYSVIVGNAFGATVSSNALLAIRIPATIVTQPQSQTANPGSTVILYVYATGTEPISYQWQRNGTNLTGTVSTYTINNVQSYKAGAYSVVVSNAAGVEVSEPAVLTVNTPPAITAQPQSQTNLVGGNALLAVTATGTEPLSYQWRFQGTNLFEENERLLYLFDLTTNMAGPYAVVVTNAFGAVTSAAAQLTVNWPLKFQGMLRLPDGRTRLDMSGQPGSYHVEYTESLTNWIEISNLLNPGGWFNLVDPGTNPVRRFYRLRQGP